MAFRDLSDPHAVLSALAEFDRLGRAAFLERYGFGEAVSYFIDHEGKLYDSKPIVAAAHGYQFGDPLPNRFSGGERTIARLLDGLGFVITRPEPRDRQPDWARDELILALDAYLHTRGLVAWRQTTPQAVELSRVLRDLAIFPPHVRDNPGFRTPSSVGLKVSNFAAIDPSNGQAGMGHSARSDRATWNDWAHRPEELRLVARAILRASSQPDAQETTDDEEEASAEEGRLLYRLHRRRERDRGLVRAKKAAVRRATGRLACEVCDFESGESYGEGVEVIEVHHIVPLHRAGESRTTLSDLALLCPTCHRVIHARRPFSTPAHLKLARRLSVPPARARSGDELLAPSGMLYR